MPEAGGLGMLGNCAGGGVVRWVGWLGQVATPGVLGGE